MDALIALLSALAPTFAFILGKTLLISMRFKGAMAPGWRSNPLWKGRYDILATGPLLGVKGHRGRSGGSAIGFEHFLQMKPMDFDEFLWATGLNENVIALLKKNLEIWPPSIPHYMAFFID